MKLSELKKGGLYRVSWGADRKGTIMPWVESSWWSPLEFFENSTILFLGHGNKKKPLGESGAFRYILGEQVFDAFSQGLEFTEITVGTEF